MSSINMNDIQMIDPNNLDQKQTGTNQVVMHQPLPASTHVNTEYISNPNQPQIVPIDQNGHDAPVIISNGAKMNNPMAPEMMNIPEYTTWSILNILFCCLILGIFACVKSRETKNYKLSGNFQGAQKASKWAKNLNFSATVIGIIIIITVSALGATNTFQSYSYNG